MNEAILFGLGIVSSLAPCPLATHMAALGYLSQYLGEQRKALLGALLYAAGRMGAYSLLGILLSTGTTGIPALSYSLQKGMPYVMGPLLMLTGLVLLELLTLPEILQRSAPPLRTVNRLLQLRGVWGAFPLGLLFALALCPTSAALLFGSAWPLATNSALPVAIGFACFGLGSALPIIIAALGICLGAAHIHPLLRHLPRLRRAITTLTGIALLVGGAWQCIDTLILNP